MATCSHADSLFALQGIGSYAITRGGSAEQRPVAPEVATGEVLAGAGADGARSGLGSQEHHDDTSPTRRRLRPDRPQVLHLQRRRGRLLHDARTRSDGLSLFLVPADARRHHGHAGAGADRAARARRRRVRRCACCPPVAARRARSRARPGAVDAGRVPHLGRRRVRSGWPRPRSTRRHATPDPRAVRPAAHPARAGRRPLRRQRGPTSQSARLLTYRAAELAGDDPLGQPRALVAGQARRDRSRLPSRRPLRAGDGPVGDHPGLEDRALLPAGAADAHLRRGVGGAPPRHRPTARPRRSS